VDVAQEGERSASYRPPPGGAARQLCSVFELRSEPWRIGFSASAPIAKPWVSIHPLLPTTQPALQLVSAAAWRQLSLRRPSRGPPTTARSRRAPRGRGVDDCRRPASARSYPTGGAAAHDRSANGTRTSAFRPDRPVTERNRRPQLIGGFDKAKSLNAYFADDRGVLRENLIQHGGVPRPEEPNRWRPRAQSAMPSSPLRLRRTPARVVFGGDPQTDEAPFHTSLRTGHTRRGTAPAGWRQPTRQVR
jgi:hypothetical protein